MTERQIHRTAEIEPLVPHHREQGLRKGETQIRSAALPLIHSDPLIKLHLNAVCYAEDLHDIHSGAAEAHEKKGRQAFAEIHERHKAAAMQIKLYHLDQLSNLVL